MIPALLPDAFAATRGECCPNASAAAYRDAAAAWAETWAQPGESQTLGFLRAVANGSEVVDIFYRAASIAHALDTLDLTELIPLDRPDAYLRYIHWARLLDLAASHRAPDEELPSTIRRLVGSNADVRAAYLLIIQ